MPQWFLENQTSLPDNKNDVDQQLRKQVLYPGFKKINLNKETDIQASEKKHGQLRTNDVYGADDQAD